jgi:hypothetical protein
MKLVNSPNYKSGHIFNQFPGCKEIQAFSGKLDENCIILSLFKHETLTQLCCIPHRAGPCLRNVFHRAQCSFATLLQRMYVSWKKCCKRLCQKYTSKVSCKRKMYYRIVENYHVIDSVPDKNKAKKLAFFLNGAWFTLTRNISSQNNSY